MSRYQNREEVAAKMDWEGGLESFLHYGIDESDLPKGDEELLQAFLPMKAAWGLYQKAAIRFKALLPHEYMSY